VAKTHRFQFRLRTLMLFVTIVAFLAWASNQLWTNAMEGHRAWLRANGLTDPDFPEPDKK
jgi:hypothetical protein